MPSTGSPVEGSARRLTGQVQAGPNEQRPGCTRGTSGSSIQRSQAATSNTSRLSHPVSPRLPRRATEPRGRAVPATRSTTVPDTQKALSLPGKVSAALILLACAHERCHAELHDVRHGYATAGRNAKIDWKTLSKRIGQADVASTMKRYVQTDLDADREVANTLADLIMADCS